MTQIAHTTHHIAPIHPQHPLQVLSGPLTGIPETDWQQLKTLEGQYDQLVVVVQEDQLHPYWSSADLLEAALKADRENTTSICSRDATGWHHLPRTQLEHFMATLPAKRTLLTQPHRVRIDHAWSSHEIPIDPHMAHLTGQIIERWKQQNQDLQHLLLSQQLLQALTEKTT